MDALQLYRQGRLVSRRIVPVHRRGAEVDVVCQYLERGSRIATVGGAEILLTPRQQVPHRIQRLITAECPGCGGQFRHLYLVGEGGPKCRRCHGLIYASQARSQVARFRRRSELARQRRSWDRIRPIPYHWMNRFTTEGILLERRRELRESRAICKELESRRTAEERERASAKADRRQLARDKAQEWTEGLVREGWDEQQARQLAYAHASARLEAYEGRETRKELVALQENVPIEVLNGAQDETAMRQKAKEHKQVAGPQREEMNAMQKKINQLEAIVKKAQVPSQNYNQPPGTTGARTANQDLDDYNRGISTERTEAAAKHEYS